MSIKRKAKVRRDPRSATYYLPSEHSPVKIGIDCLVPAKRSRIFSFGCSARYQLRDPVCLAARSNELQIAGLTLHSDRIMAGYESFEARSDHRAHVRVAEGNSFRARCVAQGKKKAGFGWCSGSADSRQVGSRTLSEA